MVEQKWRPNRRPQDMRVGKFFMLSDFLYSEDAVMTGLPNCPFFDSPEVAGIRGLCSAIIDPVVEEFGPVSITFGYVSPQIWRKWYGKNVAIEGLHVFRPMQGGIGGAADLLVHSHENNPRTVLNWIRENCVYDRLILYPGSPIICVAWTEIDPRYECKEWIFDEIGKSRYVNAGREAAPRHPGKKRTFDQGKLFLRNILSLIRFIWLFRLICE